MTVLQADIVFLFLFALTYCLVACHISLSTFNCSSVIIKTNSKPLTWHTLLSSSFLKQHSDEEAVFQSFRDINELIKDMLELKGRYGSVETELKEMHDRYSQLSLQFAEVEGERQKLMMTLKNVRALSKKAPLSRSSTTPLGDHLP